LAPPCPNNCSFHGECKIDDDTGIQACDCEGKYHGIDCAAAGGLSKAAIAGIAGGVIAAIVIAACVGFLVIGYGLKRGVDWMMLNQQMAANSHDNPLHKPATTEHDNQLFKRQSSARVA
jgi:hypothetical protein